MEEGKGEEWKLELDSYRTGGIMEEGEEGKMEEGKMEEGKKEESKLELDSYQTWGIMDMGKLMRETINIIIIISKDGLCRPMQRVEEAGSM